VINRVGWDGAIRPPDANELGWKDTVRMNPLEDAIVALRPTQFYAPFLLPNSYRPMDVANPLGSTMGFFGVDTAGNPVTVTNAVVNFGWEYVWHCHLLGHEENDMMRPMIFASAPETPTLLTAVRGTNNKLTWRDNSLNESSWTVYRATSLTGPWVVATTTAVVKPGLGAGTIISATDNLKTVKGTVYYYYVVANNRVGSAVAGYPTMTASSLPSNILTVP
jgi:hypothetical protein